MNILTNNYPGAWGVAHIVYFVISTILLVSGLILIKRYVKKEKTVNLIIKISAAILLVLFITNRIGYMVRYIYIDKVEGYSWLNVFPETFCSVSALIFSVAVLFLKKDNFLIHGIIHMTILGALETSLYPSFLNNQGLWEVGTITSLLYHTVMLFLAILVIVTKYVKLTIKKWYIQPILFMLIICYGLFYLQAILGGDTPDNILNINQPFIKSLPTLTSWWMIGLAYLAWDIIFLTLYDHFVNKKKFKTIGYEFIHPFTNN